MVRLVRISLAAAVAAAALPGVAGSEAATGFTKRLRDGLLPAAFSGQDVLAFDRRGVVAVSPDGSHRLLRVRRVRSVAGSQSQVAVAAGRPSLTTNVPPGTDPGAIGPGAGRVRVLAGPPEGTLSEIARCGTTRAGFVAPVVAGASAVWRGCDTRSVVVGDDQRTTLPAQGVVVALASFDRRVGWVESRGEAPAVAVSADLDTGGRSELTLPVALTVSPPGITLSMDAAGRARVTRDGPRFRRCDVFDSDAGGPYVTVGGADCGQETLTPDGSVGVGGDGGYQVLVARHATNGPALTLARTYFSLPLGYAADAGRIAYARRGCTRQTLISTTVRAAKRAGRDASCPVRLLTRRARVSGRGRVAFKVRCPRGCVLREGDVEPDGGEGVEDAGASIVGKPPRTQGGSLRVRMRLNRFARMAVAKRGPLGALVSFTRFDGTTVGRRVTLVR